MTQVFLAIAAVLGGLSVAAGAFGSHALKERLTDRSLEILILQPATKCITRWQSSWLPCC